MVQPLSHLRDRAKENWLLGCDRAQLIELTESRFQALQNHIFRSGSPPTVLLGEVEPLAFLAGFVAATATQCPVFLGNPYWAEAEWQQVLHRVQPDIVWSHLNQRPSQEDSASISAPNLFTPNDSKPSPQPGWIMIPTGGSSGQIRFAIHTWQTLLASVRGFKQYFQIEQINSYCVLPLYHVSGLMQFIRSFTSGGKLVILPFKKIETSKGTESGKDIVDAQEILLPEFVLSLVPTQLQGLLQSSQSTCWLSRFHMVLLGGAPAWSDLLATAKRQKIRLAPTYGMTETASQIATLKPEDFLRGQTGSGQQLPHAELTICDREGRSLPPHQIGTVTVQASSLALGYYPERFHQAVFQTDDLGYLDADGYLHIVGRNSQKVITGGENVFPVEVEAAIRSTQLVRDVCVFGLPDAHWGEAVTAAYVPISPDITIAMLQTALEPHLSKFKRPKYWIPLSQISRNAQGKVNYQQLKQLSASQTLTSIACTSSIPMTK